MKDSYQYTYLYGLEHASHDFTTEEAFGKNIFTNAFPVALCNYMAIERGLDFTVIEATDCNGTPAITHSRMTLEQIINVSPKDAFWGFEDSFEGYNVYATNTANRSDLVAKNRHTGKETRALEVKLVTVPTSGTANKPRSEQSCELVVRPPSIEQVCFSIVASYGAARRHELGDIITGELGNAADYDWKNKKFMSEHLSKVVNAADKVIIGGINSQTPFALNAIWRTVGQDSVLDEECFDVLFWTEMAFVQLFTDTAKRAIARGVPSEINRPSRALIWLVKSLLDYAWQGAVTFERTHGLITFDAQTDKAGSFTGNNSLKFVKCQDFIHPRVSATEYENIIKLGGVGKLKPERRLDAVLIKMELDKLLSEQDT